MTCVQIESIHIDSFKNVIKKSKLYSVAMVTSQNSPKEAKNVFMPTKISQDRTIVKN